MYTPHIHIGIYIVSYQFSVFIHQFNLKYIDR